MGDLLLAVAEAAVDFQFDGDPAAAGRVVALLDDPDRLAAALGGVESFAEESSEVALAGKDGARAATLLANAKREGTAVLSRLAEAAVGRLLASGSPLSAPVLFTDGELAELAGSLGSTVATADLLGRARIRRRAEMAAGTPAPQSFAEAPDDPFTVFDDSAPGGIPFLAPEQALDYFRGLVPSLSGDPARYGPLLQRHAFTLAHATDQTLLEKVKAAILARLSGDNPAPGNVAVEDVLDAAGVSPKNPAYAETVYRTNMLDSLNAGAYAELAEPDMQEAFPVYRYDAITDTRARPTHAARDGKYYPSSAPFAAVRGTGIGDVANCRCGFTPVYKTEWADLQKRGVKVEGSS